MSDIGDCPFDGMVPTSGRRLRSAIPPPKSKSEIDRLSAAPIECLAFKDFANLKSGRDNFSRIKLPELQGAVSVMDRQSIEATFINDDKTQAACLRWILRGLHCSKAIRKARTDLEVSAKAISKWKC